MSTKEANLTTVLTLETTDKVRVVANGSSRNIRISDLITVIATPEPNAQVGTTYLTTLEDGGGGTILMSNSSSNVITISANAVVPYPIGTRLNFMQYGAGTTTIAINGDTLDVNAVKTLVLNGQFAEASALKVTEVAWVLTGNLVAA